MAEADEKYLIEKLGAANWDTWKIHVKHLLLARDLWGHVDGSSVLAADANEQVRTAFARKEQRALSTLVLSISASQLYLVTQCETAKATWDTLKGHFERNTLSNKLMLKKQYFRCEMKEGMSVEGHLKEMKILTDKLAALGAPVAEEDQVVTLLGSLPRSYAGLVTALEARENDLSINYVQQALVHEEKKLTEGKSDAESSCILPFD